MRGKVGVSLLDAAWRTPGLADLVTVPLYLRALLEIAPETVLPETKEEVLRGLIRTHESQLINREIFHQRLLGEQKRYLTALVVKAQKLGSPTLPEAVAKQVVGAANVAIKEEGLGASPLDALKVLDVLVVSHTALLPENASLR